MKIGVYPGSFDPITNGHLDILKRATKVFDKVIILVGYNSEKKGRFDISTRVEMIKEAIEELNIPNIEVDSYMGLTVEYAKKKGATHLIRGLRAVTDFEYEFQLAEANEYIDSSIDTVFLMANTEKSFINSSMIMDMHNNGVDVSKLVPNSVLKRLK